MSIRQFFEVLKARWRLAMLVLAGAVGFAVVISLVLPSQYTATASVLVDMRSADPLAGTPLATMLGSGYMTTQMDVVQSERVTRRAIEMLGLDDDTEMKRRWEEATDGKGSFQAWIAEGLQKKLEVLPTRESGVMSIKFTAPDSDAAAATANAFVKAYIETTLALRVAPARRYSNFFEERAKQLREALEAAQAKLSVYQQENGIVGSDERLDIENTRLGELSSRLAALQGATVDSSSRQRQASVDADRMTEVFNNPVVAGLTADLSRQQLRLGELQQRLGEQHPQVQEVVATVTRLRTQIAAETRRVTAAMGVNSQIDQSRESQLRALLAQQRAKVLRLKSQRDGATVLQRDVENARIAYDAVRVRAAQAGLESQDTQTNVSVLKDATPPALASSPKLGSNVLVAFVLGLLLAVATVLIRELTDRRLRTREDVVGALNQSLLVVLSRGTVQLPSSASSAGLVKARLLRGLVSPVR